MPFIAVAFAGAATLILTAMPSSAHEHSKADRLGALEQQPIHLEGTDSANADTSHPTPHRSTADDTKPESTVRRTESGIRIVGAPFLPER